MPDRSPFLTVAEAAAYLRVSETAIYRAVRRDEIPAIRVGSAIRIPRTALELDEKPAPRRRRAAS